MRWTPKTGWERTAIPANEQVYAVINDSGIWTAYSENRTTRLQHYTPAGKRDIDLPLKISTSDIHTVTTANGVLYLLYKDGCIIFGTPAEFKDYVSALATGRFPGWLPLTPWYLMGFGKPLEPGRSLIAEQAVLVYTEPGYRPALLAGASRGPVATQANSDKLLSAALDPSLSAYSNAFTTYRDTTGEWLVMGGKDGVVMLPTSVIRVSLFAASNGKSIETSEIYPANR